MPMERRGWATPPSPQGQPAYREEPAGFGRGRQPLMGGTSRMTGDGHVRNL